MLFQFCLYNNKKLNSEVTQFINNNQILCFSDLNELPETNTEHHLPCTLNKSRFQSQVYLRFASRNRNENSRDKTD